MSSPLVIALELALAVLLIVAAVIDARTYRIANRLTLAVAVLAPLHWWASGLPPWPGAAAQLGAALLVFGLFAGLFYAGMMGGGDVKLAAALALWFPPTATLRFLVLMSLAGGALTVFLLIRHRLRRAAGQPKVAYGIAIAAGGLAILAQRFLNQFA